MERILALVQKALHLAAKSAGAEVLLSTDDRFIKRAARWNGLARFLRLHRSGAGDYTHDRIEWHKDLTVDQILESIRHRRD